MTSPAHTRSHSATSSSASVESGRRRAQLRPRSWRRVRASRCADGVVQRARRRIERAPTPGRAAASWSAKHSRIRPSRRPDRAGADPHHLARRAQLVEHRRPVAAHPRRQHVGLDRRGHERARRTARRAPRRAPPARADRRGCRATPGGSGRSAGRSTGSTSRRSAASDRRRSWRSTSTSHHSRCTPSGRNSPCTTRSSASRATIAPATRSAVVPNRRATSSTTNGPCVRANRPTSSSSGRGDRLGERHRQPERQRAPERIAVAGGVLGGRVARLAADGDLDRPRSATSSASHAAPSSPSQRRSTSAGGEVADLAEHVVQLVGRACPAPLGEALQLELDVGEHARIEQLAQLLGAEQVAQQVAVERQRRGPPLGQRGIALVHVGGDPVEQQARRHRAGLRGVDLDDPDRPRPELAEHLAQGGHVEHVLQALARRLEQDRERRVLRGHRQQIGRTLALLPQRRAPIGPAARQQQRPTGALAEAGREQRRLRQRRHDELVDVVGVDQQRVERELVGGLGQPDDDAVVAPHRLDRQVERIHQAGVRSPSPTARARACRTG